MAQLGSRVVDSNKSSYCQLYDDSKYIKKMKIKKKEAEKAPFKR